MEPMKWTAITSLENEEAVVLRCNGANCYTATPYRGIALHRNEGPLRRNSWSVTHDGHRAAAGDPGEGAGAAKC
jgi:hypothetical protein